MTIEDNTGTDPDARTVAIEMLKAGEAAPSDIAKLAGVDRQVVHYWIKAAGLDPAAAYDERIARLWRKRMSRRKGAAPGRRPSKDELRAQADKMVAAFNAKHRARRSKPRPAPR